LTPIAYPTHHLLRLSSDDQFYTLQRSVGCMGPSIKYVTLEKGGVREGVTFCDSGEGV